MLSFLIWLDALIAGFCLLSDLGLNCIANFQIFGLFVCIRIKRIDLVSDDLGLMVDLNTWV